MLISLFTRLQSVLRTDEGTQPSPRRRGRHQWSFLALAYIAIDTIGSSNAAGSGGRRSADDDDAQGTQVTAADHDLGGSDAENIVEISDSEGASGADGVNHPISSPLDLTFSLGPVVASATFGGSAGILVASGTSANAGAVARGSSTFPPPLSTDGVMDGPKEITPTIEFFQGFDALGSELGFGSAFRSIATIAPEGSGGIIAAGLAFSDSPLAPISTWASLGGMSLGHKFYQGDQFNAEFAIQATGRTDKGLMHGQGAHGVEAGTLVQWGNAQEKTVGNEATLIDTSDWDGALVVKGNYYEFNTIVQINVIWNKDVIATTLAAPASPHGDAGSLDADANGAHSSIDTGGHNQMNYAQIIEYATGGSGALRANELVHDGSALARVSAETRAGAAHSNLDAETGFDHQIFAGGSDKNNAVLQLQTVVENDTIDFIIADTIAGSSNVLVPFFADVTTGGSKQSNTSLIATRAGEVDPFISVQSYVAHLRMAEPKTHIEIVDGDYYEFNTVFQINLVNDRDVINRTAEAPGSGQSILTTGGNIQFNAASIVKDDAGDYLYVGGRYTQYNLVMQVNALDNSSQISQTVSFGRPDAPPASGSGEDHGDDGDNGGIYNAHAPSYHAPDQLMHY